jgi:hypothetical protein
MLTGINATNQWKYTCFASYSYMQKIQFSILWLLILDTKKRNGTKKRETKNMKKI